LSLAQARFISLRQRLLALVALVLLPWLALVLYTQAEERRAAIADVHRDEMRLLAIVTSNQAAEIEATRQLLAAMTRMPQLRSGDCGGFLAEMRTTAPMYLNFGVVEPDGEVSCSGVPLQFRVNVADRMYFRRAVATREFAVGEYQIGRITFQPSINYAQPVLDAQGQVLAILYAAQSLNWLTVSLTKVEFPGGAVLTVTDRNNTVLARLPDPGDIVGQVLPDVDVLTKMAAQKDSGVFEADDAKGERRLWTHARLIAGHDLHALIGVSKTAAFAEVNRRFARNLAALGLVTLIALVAAWFGGRFILRQVDGLVAATRKLEGGQLGVQTSVVGDRSELELLARAFNEMSGTLEVRDRELREAEAKTRAAEIDLAVTHAHMDIAKQIQRSLLPEAPLTLAGMRVAGRCIPANAVGGDYFGYFPRGRDGLDSFIGDVSGHGVGAALLMAEARITFLAERMVEPGAAQILARLNGLLHDDLDRAGHFITACCATFDAGSRELKYANAGHPPALLLRAGAPGWTTLQADGVLLGIQPSVHFAEVRVKMNTGDIVVFYTDGVTEMQNEGGEMYGLDRLAESVVTHRDADPETVVGEVIASLDRFAGGAPREDDLTIVVMKLVS
jgi:serine phosphatase RsbU (regulator of sigma subunit)